MGIKRLSVIAALVALLGGTVFVALPAQADCQTTCNQYGSQQQCHTHCW